MVAQFHRAGRARSFALAVIVTTGMAAWVAPSASAAAVNSNGFLAAGGETNNLTVTQDLSGSTTTVTYSDAGNQIDASGVLCVQNGTGPGNSVTCTVPSGFGSIVITLLDNDDQTTFVNLTDIVVNQRGGTGDDVLRGTQLSVTASGGEGNDVLFAATRSDSTLAQDSLSGGPGDDVLNSSTSREGSALMDGGTGADRMLGGPGEDFVVYFDRARDLTITLDDQANDGETGEGDNLLGSIDLIFGGLANDSITGREGNETLIGDEGNDLLDGGAGEDTLDGGGGADVYRGGDGIDSADVIGTTQGRSFAVNLSVTLDDIANDGAAGERDNVGSDVEDVATDAANDTLVGTAGFNVLNGRGGNDTVDGGAGNDVLRGGPGDDTILARDGFADRVDCGLDTDTAIVDTLDVLGGNCERVDRADVGNANNVGNPGGAGNPGPVTATDDAPPKVTLTSPAPDATIRSDTPTTLSATATDDFQVRQVLFMVGERVVCTATTAPYTCRYQPRGEDVGRNTLLAVAVDGKGQTSFATRSVTVPRFTATRLSAATTPRTDTRAPYRFTTTGKLTLPASVGSSLGCRGVVAVQMKAGTKTISTRRIKLSKGCTYRSQVTFRLPRRLNPRSLRIQATFAGNTVVVRKQSPRTSVRLR